MSTLLAMALAAAATGPPVPVAARLDGLALVPFEGRVAIRINYTGRPGPVSVTRSGNVARVTLTRTDLGWRFGAGRRFEWRPGAAPLASFATADRSLERLRVEAGRGEASLVFDLPPDIVVELRQVKYALLVILREAPNARALVAQAPPPPRSNPVFEPAPPPPAPLPPAVKEAPRPTPAAETSAPVPDATPPAEAATLFAQAPAAVSEAAPGSPIAPAPPEETATATAAAEPATATSDLYRLLFPPAASPAATDAEGDDTVTLYARLFPGATTAESSAGEDLASVAAAKEPVEGFGAGPFRLRPFFTASYVNADASLLSTPGTVKDSYFQFEPGLAARAPLGDGSFTAEYAPAFRAGASYAATQHASHVLTGTLELPFGADSTLTVTDRFVVSTLDTREVDPGGEYFFDLAPFNRNLLSANARVSVGSRTFLELGGAFSHANFDRPGGFFGYDSRLLSAGAGYELTPTLRATLSYVYDEIPEPQERPEAAATASSAVVALQGDLLPLLTGRLAFGYRDQESPNAALPGRRFQGLTMSGSLTREFGRESSLSLLLNRSTPASNFEANGFYVNTTVAAALAAPLPGALSLETGLGYTWNDYDVDAPEIGAPREDRIFSLYAGLRRPVGRQWWASAFYRRERRRSNLDAFDLTADGFLVQVSWGFFGPRR